MYLEPDWSFEDFLSAAGQRLTMALGAARKAFHANGATSVTLRKCLSYRFDNASILFIIFSPFDPLLTIKLYRGRG
jgi:hypothetical protein